MKSELDKIYVHGSCPIDSLAVSEELIEFMEGLKLITHNEIVLSDYRAFIIDINFEDYFNDEMSSWDNINYVILDPARKSYHLKFVEKLEEQLDRYQIKSIIKNNLALTDQ